MSFGREAMTARAKRAAREGLAFGLALKPPRCQANTTV